jgi:dCMP deaminase
VEWHEYFLRIAATVALKSKDESSKIGAVIVGPEHEIRSTGYNGFPRGFDDNDYSKQQRPIKYKYFEHAERNAIYNAARFGASTKDCTMYCQWPPCTDCARAIVQSGIKQLVVQHRVIECPERWRKDMKIALSILNKCGVSLVIVPLD